MNSQKTYIGLICGVLFSLLFATHSFSISTDRDNNCGLKYYNYPATDAKNLIKIAEDSLLMNINNINALSMKDDAGKAPRHSLSLEVALAAPAVNEQDKNIMPSNTTTDVYEKGSELLPTPSLTEEAIHTTTALIVPLGISYETNKTGLRAVERSIDLFVNRIRGSFSVWLERSSRYVEIMKDILQEKDLPEELVFLPVIESGFNVNARSHAGAVGPWQFMPATAKMHGLVIDWWRDERKDPIKSTRAAATYLNNLYNMFGSWKLALAAYNAGNGRISRAIRRANSDDFWTLKESRAIPRETQEYVPRYIAATIIATRPEEHGFYNLNRHEPLEFDEVTINFPLDIEVIARTTETTKQEIRRLNPELRRWSTPLNVLEYTVRIPAGTRDIFFENLEKIPENERFSISTYKVRKGDTLRSISRRTGVSISAIRAINNMNRRDALRAGQEINLPPRGKYFADASDRAPDRTSTSRTSVRTSGNNRKPNAAIAPKAKTAPAKPRLRN